MSAMVMAIALRKNLRKQTPNGIAGAYITLSMKQKTGVKRYLRIAQFA